MHYPDRHDQRPTGISSRLHPFPEQPHCWQAPNGHLVHLPVVFDIVEIDAAHEVVWAFIATVDLVDSEPGLVALTAEGPRGLDVVRLQRAFRWATPVDVVRRLVPQLLARGADPYTHCYPTSGYPAAAGPSHKKVELSEEFLEEIARQYLAIGRGYIRTIAEERGVSERTVVSWIEKARQRHILTPTTKGTHGGTIIPPSQRPTS